MITLVLSTLLLVLTLTFTYILLRTFAFKSINNPSFPPVKGTLLHLILHLRRLHDFFTTIAVANPTFRILLPASQSYVYTAEPRNIEHVLKENFGNYSKGDQTREIFAELFGDGVFLADGDSWRHQRKLSSLEFSTRVLRDFSSSVFRTNAAKLVQVVSEFSDSARVFDMQGLLMRCTLDSIFQVGFGVELNCLDGSSEEATQFMSSFDALNELTFCRFMDPLWKCKRFLHIGSELSLTRHVKVVHKFVHQFIKKKRILLEMNEETYVKNKKEDILSRFLVESKKDPEKMDDKYLRDIVMNFIIAGKDTTAGTLTWFFYMLCKHPLVEEKVLQEIRHVVGSDVNNNVVRIDDFVKNITEAALQKMHYLQATLTETLRLYPSVPVDGRCAKVDDILPNGFKIKKGDEIFYMSYAMGRMPYIWGEDATDFRPDRWLNNEVFQPESPFKFVAFHAGPRICIGKDFAYRQMKIVSIALLRFFHFKLGNEVKSLTYKPMITLHIVGDVPMYAISRKI